jgi:hypothetical protein
MNRPELKPFVTSNATFNSTCKKLAVKVATAADVKTLVQLRKVLFSAYYTVCKCFRCHLNSELLAKRTSSDTLLTPSVGFLRRN